MLNKIIIFIFCLIPWFFFFGVQLDYSCIGNLDLPFFTPPGVFYLVIWSIVYFLIAICIFNCFYSYHFKEIPLSYKVTLLINYLFTQSFILMFFGFKLLFFSFICCLGTFISSLFLYHETFKLKERSVRLLDPYVLLSLFTTILSLMIYLMNTPNF